MDTRSTLLRSLLAVSILVVADGLLPKAVRAETRTAAALTPEAVWDAINAANDGDTVQLPEGTAVWKNGWNTKHWAKIKAITIQGAGIDKTILCMGPGKSAFTKPLTLGTANAVYFEDNEVPKPDYYRPYAYPHPLQGGREAN